VPGVAVSSAIVAAIDTNADGEISETERRAYAERVLGDLSLSVDGNPLRLKLVSQEFPSVVEMQQGLGQIEIEFTADLPFGGPNRQLIFENHHQNQIAAYLVNVLVPRDPEIRIVAQRRNDSQSFYRLDYVQEPANSSRLPLTGWWGTLRERVSAIGFGSVFRLGVRHIAEGTDHLLFLLALLLPAPMLVSGSCWSGFAGIRDSLLRILKVVSAFTLGHSVTLAMAALGVVHVPSRPIEILIAVSILVSAIHALRPLFPGRESAIAGFFGLVHGLAFATTLGELGFGPWARVANLMAFNLGIEAMQIVVVAAILPSLLVLSRTPTYSVLRIGGALFAGCAALGWIVERTTNVHAFSSAIVDDVAHRAVWVAAALGLGSCISLAGRLRTTIRGVRIQLWPGLRDFQPSKPVFYPPVADPAPLTEGTKQ
jgi:hypothetical protein